MKKKNSATASRLVSYQDCAAIIGLSLESVPALVAAGGHRTVVGPGGRPSISHSAFLLLARDPNALAEAETAGRNEAERRIRDATSGADEWFKKDIHAMLASYRLDIGSLAHIHAKYLAVVRPLERQDATTAAYVLYGRAINLLNMGCAALEAGFWNAGLLLRQIDETVQLAEYFSRCVEAPHLQRDVDSWFLENRTPEPSDIRQALAKRHSIDFGEIDSELHLATMNDLYRMKSKWIHPALPPIRETLRTYPTQNGASVLGFDYGPSSCPRKLHELTEFYRSSVWTCATGFCLCFQEQLPLEPEDAETVRALDQKFARMGKVSKH